MRATTLLCVLAGCAADALPPMGMPPPEGPPPGTVGGFSVAIPELTLAPGEEIEPCWIFPLEPTGPSRIVGGAVVRVGAGMHHGNITSRPATGEGMRACPPDDGDPGFDILMGGSVLFASSTQVAGEEWYSFPAGHGYRVKDGHEIVARMHFLNPGDEPITVAPTYDWYTIDEASVVHELAPFAWTYREFMIPPGEELTVTGECALPQGEHPMHVVTMLPHMHRLGTALDAAFLGGPFAGQRFLDTPGYDPEAGVLRQYEPAVDFSDADGFTFSCTWRNTLDKTIVEGIGDNEMCIVFGYAWPKDHSYSAIASEAGCIVAPAPP